MIPAAPLPEVLPRAACAALLEKIAALRLGVLGDFTLDGYWYADMTRAQLSRETPLFPRPVVRETYSNGGAANVAWNLADLGLSRVYAFTIFGADWRGALLRQTLTRAGVRVETAAETNEWLTPFYGKVILMNGEIQQEDGRVDFVNTRPVPAAALDEMLAGLERLLPELDGLVVADYQSEGVAAGRGGVLVQELAARHPEKVFMVDSRDRLGQYAGLVLKPNDLEAARLMLPGRGDAVPLEELAAAGLERQRGSRLPLFITLGGQGCLVIAGGEARRVPGVALAPPLDPVGAGDTFLSACSAALAAGAHPLQAAALANLAAAVSVRKLRITGTASPQEILGLYAEL